jgi:two-component system sensor histidine kinase UhpB
LASRNQLLEGRIQLLEGQLRESESRLRLYSEQLPALAWATDRDLRVVWNQGAAFQSFGIDPKTLLGRTVAEMLGPDSAATAGALEAHLRALRGETVAYEKTDGSVTMRYIVGPSRDVAGDITGVLGVALDVTDGKRAQSELAEKRELLQSLSWRLITTQEAERRALARELHDDFGQLLTAIRLALEAARRETTGAGRQQLGDGIGLVDQAIDRVRSLATDLRPPILDDLGLVAALRGLLRRQFQHAGFEGRLQVKNLEGRLPTAIETCAFRLVQEALTNVARHAGAKNVDVELSATEGDLGIIVRDDGRGFDASAARHLAPERLSLGLLSMRERVTLAGGHLDIRSSVGAGTTIEAHLPISREPPSYIGSEGS